MKAAILDDPDTDAATKDIKEFQKSKPDANAVSIKEQKKQAPSDAAINQNTSDGDVSIQETPTDTIYLDFGFTNRDTSGAGEAFHWVNNVSDGSTHGEMAHSVMMGNAWALSRITGGRYSPPSSGWYDVKLPYYLLGNTVLANTTIYLFRRDHTRGDNQKFEVRSPSGAVDKSFTDWRGFHLEADHEYNIGFEIHGEANTLGADSLSDFYYRQLDDRTRHAKFKTNWLEIY